MSKTDNLSDFLTDVADAIRAKKGTTDLINPQDFSSEIALIEGGGGKIKLPDGTKFGYSTNLDILANVDTSEMTDLSNMFNECSLVTSIDLSSLETSKVTSMRSMFRRCKKVTSFNLSSFDTSKVVDMRDMFADCMAVTSLDLSSFDTSALTDMTSMFYNCYSLKSIDLSSFNTSKVTSLANLFYSCSLEEWSLTSWDTSSVKDMSALFQNCKPLKRVDLSSFNTSSVTNISKLFQGCSNIEYIDLSSFDTTNVTNATNAFAAGSKLSSLLLGPNFFKTKSVTSIDFSACSAWVGDTVVTSLVTNSYDRAAAGLGTLTLKLSTNTKAALTDEQKAAITAKGYTIA